MGIESDMFETLPSVRARYGYWVKSSSFVSQRVALRGPIYRVDGAVPGLTDIPTATGWNFVGVIDIDGDQTEDHFGAIAARQPEQPGQRTRLSGCELYPCIYLGCHLQPFRGATPK